jgi:hypothetical protein
MTISIEYRQLAIKDIAFPAGIFDVVVSSIREKVLLFHCASRGFFLVTGGTTERAFSLCQREGITNADRISALV